MESAAKTATLRAERDRFVAFAFAAADLLLEVDRNGVIGFLAGASETLTHHAPDALMGRSLFELLAESDRPLVKMLLRTLDRGGRLTPIAVRLHEAVAAVVLGGCRLPTDRERYHLTISAPTPVLRLADRPGARDPQTGVLDKNDFARLASEQMLAQRDGPLKLTVLRLKGLDGLRARVDEELAQGFLAAVGRHLRARSADSDAAGRLDEERFGLLHQTGLDAASLCQEIAGLAAGVDGEGGGLDINASTLALDRQGLNDADAVRALVHAINTLAGGEAGAPTIASLKDGLATVVNETSARMRELRQHLDGVSLVYQPIVALASRKPHHVEALARFRDGGSPASTIAFAEQVGVITELDLAICHKVIDTLKTRRETTAGLPIAVNVSGHSLESKAFAVALQALLSEHEAISDRLLIEVTESSLITQLDEVGEFLRSLRARGFRICLDDFGAGAAAFHYLHAFAVDFVKIDGRYVRQAMTEKRDMAFLKAMAGLCHALGTAVIAEMIETEAQCACLVELGIEFGQGYLFGKPAASIEPARAPARLNLKRRGAVESWG